MRGGGRTWKTLQPDSSPHWGQGLSSPASLPLSQVQQVYPRELLKLCSPDPLLQALGVPRVLKNPTFSLGTKSHPNLPFAAQGLSPPFTGPCTSPSPPTSPGTSASFQPCTRMAAPRFPNPRWTIWVTGFFLSISTHTHTHIHKDTHRRTHIHMHTHIHKHTGQSGSVSLSPYTHTHTHTPVM